MEIDLPQKFVLRRKAYAFQLFGRQLLERIPGGALILAERHSSDYVSMIEVVWEERRYLVFERDLRELTEPLSKRPEEDPPGDMRLLEIGQRR